MQSYVSLRAALLTTSLGSGKLKAKGKEVKGK
jgi:hypothetical protein